jgi:hypothetical protein
MTGFDGTALSLTQPFRFGSLLALEADRGPAIAGPTLRLKGTDTIPTEIHAVTKPAGPLPVFGGPGRPC